MEDSDDDFKPDVDSDEDSQSPKKGGRGVKKVKQEEGGGGPKARKTWSNGENESHLSRCQPSPDACCTGLVADEVLDMWQQVGKLALGNMATIKAGMMGKRDSASVRASAVCTLRRLASS